MDPSDADDIIGRLWTDEDQLREQDIDALCATATIIFLNEPSLLKLEAPIKICGGIHGRYSAILRIFNNGGCPPTTNYLFLGNYVDGGEQSVETVCLLLAYKIRYPEKFFLLRGNHEIAIVNRNREFYDECTSKFSERIWEVFNECFNCLPVAALVDEKIFCVHAGLSPDLDELTQIENIRRPTYVPEAGLLCDLLWSDPGKDVQGWAMNTYRGSCSYTFGQDIVSEFLRKHDLSLICRAHQVVVDGYEFFGRDSKQLVTIYSAPNYCGKGSAGAIMSVDENLLFTFHDMKPAEEDGTNFNFSVTGTSETGKPVAGVKEAITLCSKEVLQYSFEKIIGETSGQSYGGTSGSQGSISSITRQTSNEILSELGITFYSYSDIVRATHGFSDLLRAGSWRYGCAYNGYLDKSEVIIKILDTEHDQGKDEFLKELKILEEVGHPNLVKLLGACIESRTVVYELLPHVLSLEDCLGKNPEFCTWQIRTRIIYQLCSVLIFLYSSHTFPIIHGSLKPSFIFLDTNNLNIKLFLPGRSPSTNPRPKGRLTEWMETGNLKISSDAYSFGVMVLTLLTGRLHAPGFGGEVQDDEWLRRSIDSKAGSWPFQLAKKLAYFASKFCNHTKNSSAIKIAEELGAIVGVIDKFTNKEPFQPFNNKEIKRDENFPPPVELVLPTTGGYGSSSRRKGEDIRVKPSFKAFSPNEIQYATNNFSKSLMIGEGGYGKVYKCQLDNWDVAVKILDDKGDQGLEEYIKEMDVLEAMRHENLIHLMGTCFRFRALVYEYLPNGSLEDYLKNRPWELTWKIRIRIVYEICTALNFLHANKPEPLVHGDLKPHNVLLGANFKVKLADFGLCRYLTQGENSKAFHQTNNAGGSVGYMDPDYLGSGKVTPGVDVYSFGKTVVKILTGQHPPDIFREVHEAKKTGSLMSIVDKTVRDWPENVVGTLARFALRSIKQDRNRSEFMGNFYSELQMILDDIDN